MRGSYERRIYDRLRSDVAERLGSRSLAHSEAVAETAGRIAELYGVDADKARLAGLLHDWCKEIHGSELIGAARDAGMPVSDVEEAVPYLVHAAVGAAELRSTFPELSEDVIHAVKAHTFGALEMNDLDRVVYCADMLEPTREISELEHLRGLPGSVSLDELFVECYSASVAHLIAMRRHIHPLTLAVWNAYVAHGHLKGGEGSGS